MRSDIVAYRGVGPERGKYIEAEDALDYAMERCGIRPSAAPADMQDRDEFNRMLVEWYFSGNWLPMEQEDGQEVEGP